MLPKQVPNEVEHESVMRAIPRPKAEPLAPQPLSPSTCETQSIAVPNVSNARSRFAANGVLLGWLLLGIVAITLAATIPR